MQQRVSLRTDKQTDKQTDRHTKVKQYTPFLGRGGIKNHKCYQSHVINYMNNYAPDPAKIHDVILVTNMRCC